MKCINLIAKLLVLFVTCSSGEHIGVNTNNGKKSNFSQVGFYYYQWGPFPDSIKGLPQLIRDWNSTFTYEGVHRQSEKKNKIIVSVPNELNQRDYFTELQYDLWNTLHNEPNPPVFVVILRGYNITILNEGHFIKALNKTYAPKLVYIAGDDVCHAFCFNEDKYPEVRPNEKRFLNANGIVGRLEVLLTIVTYMLAQKNFLANTFQECWAKAFFTNKIQKAFPITIDSKSEIFQILDGPAQDVKTGESPVETNKIVKSWTQTKPIIAIQDEPRLILEKRFQTLISHLVVDSDDTCSKDSCNEKITGSLAGKFTTLTIAVYIDTTVPFLADFFSYLSQLHYYREQISVVIHYSVTDEMIKSEIDSFAQNYESFYKALDVVFSRRPSIDIALNTCREVECSHILFLSADVHLEFPAILQLFMVGNSSSAAPLLLSSAHRLNETKGPYEVRHPVTKTSIRKDSFLIEPDLVHNVRLMSQVFGEQAAPNMKETQLHWHVCESLRIKALFVSRPIIDDHLDNITRNTDESVLDVCQRVLSKGVPIWLDNYAYHGHLVNTDYFNKKLPIPDLFEIFSNPYTWEKRYVKHQYYRTLTNFTLIEQPCRDVLMVPLFTDSFCDDMITLLQMHDDSPISQILEHKSFQQIHLGALKFDTHWLQILRMYAVDVLKRHFKHAQIQGLSRRSFIVRQSVSDSAEFTLDPDLSNYIVLTSLSKVKADFTGGEIIYERYNCTVDHIKRGYLLLSPGLMTHAFKVESLTRGLQFTILSFVDAVIEEFHKPYLDFTDISQFFTIP